MQSKQGWPATFIQPSLYAALRWRKTAFARPRNWDTCCCNPGCAKVSENKVCAEGGEISAHALHHPPSSLKKLRHHSARWNMCSKSGQSWGLLAIFLNRLCSKKGCVKGTGCSNTRDNKRLDKTKGQTHYLDRSVPFPPGGWFSHMGLFWLGFPWLVFLFWQLNDSILGLLQFCSFLCWPLVSPSHLRSGEHTLSRDT